MGWIYFLQMLTDFSGSFRFFLLVLFVINAADKRLMYFFPVKEKIGYRKFCRLVYSMSKSIMHSSLDEAARIFSGDVSLRST